MYRCHRLRNQDTKIDEMGHVWLLEMIGRDANGCADRSA